jgi:hypothetical protein
VPWFEIFIRDIKNVWIYALTPPAYLYGVVLNYWGTRATPPHTTYSIPSLFPSEWTCTPTTAEWKLLAVRNQKTFCVFFCLQCEPLPESVVESSAVPCAEANEWHSRPFWELPSLVQTGSRIIGQENKTFNFFYTTIKCEGLKYRVCILRQYCLRLWPPLWSSGQSSWLQIRRPRFDSRHYQKKKAVGLKRGRLSLASTTEELLDRKVAASV